MSTILDALKKSEQERKLNDIPTLSDMPAPIENVVWPKIAFVLAALFVVALVTFISSKWFLHSAVQPKSITISNVDSASGQVQLTVSTQSSPLRNVSTSKQGIQVNVISYSQEAEKRFVMINGKMFKENDFVQEGLKIEKIMPDFVEFNQRGNRFTKKP